MKKILFIAITLLLPLVMFAQTAEECLKIGHNYSSGRNGVSLDYKEAAKWYRKAADQGSIAALYSIGTLYENGLGVTKDITEAVKWYKKSAEQGYSIAQECLGYCYFCGRGVAKDYFEAVKWYKKAAEQGNSRAQYFLGSCYANGKGVKNDYNLAIEWYQKAAAKNNLDAMRAIGILYENGLGVTQDFQIAKEWYQKAADKGDIGSQTYLAHIYYLNEDYKMAMEWYQKAASCGNIYAMNSIGNFYEDGLGVTRDFQKAKEWYQKAADKGNASAQISLAKIYHYGYGVETDYKMAMEWYQKAASQGDLYAMVVIGSMYEDGLGVTQDYHIAKEWYQKANNKNPKYFKAKESLANLEKKIAEQSNNKNNIKVGIDIVDTGIPVISRVNNNTFAIIIANEDYQTETKVEYAKNDGEVFKNYCHKTLGLPEKNVHFVANATRNNIIGELFWLSQVCKAFKGEVSVIFYYAGHGLPDEDSGSAYLLPVDGNSQILPTCYSINELYETLGKLPAKKVTVLMDACFSGAKRNGGMLASARGVAIKAKASEPKGSMIVLSAAQGNETAYKYEEAKHGLFTYFLLKKLKDSNGNVTMGELSNYITEQVKRYSIVENGKSQTPTVQTSNNLRSTWESLKFD